MGRFVPYIAENKKCSKPPTRLLSHMEVSVNGATPQSSSMGFSDFNHEINHPASLGYPHDYGKPHIISQEPWVI